MKVFSSLHARILTPLCVFILLSDASRVLSSSPSDASPPPLAPPSSLPQPPRQSRDEEATQTARRFLSLPPDQRVAAWTRGKFGSLLQDDLDDALIASGLDTVPLLVHIVRQRKGYRASYALEVLCLMDKFVPSQDLLLPEFGATIFLRGMDLSGRINPFARVDGRRIGADAYDVIMWAAEQNTDRELRFHARSCSGLLDEDLKQLSLDQQLKRWRDGVARGKGLLATVRDPDTYRMNRLLLDRLVEAAPQSIPPLIDLLENDPSPYVREECIRVLSTIDLHRIRLRKREVGLRAIEAIRRAFEVGKLKPVYQRDLREDVWKRLRTQFFDDEVRLSHGSTWSVIALAFEKLHGEKTTRRVQSVFELIEAPPEFKQFVTYLTEVDPYFPGWEYSFIGLLETNQAMHPRFKAKVERYYEHWKLFREKQSKN